MGLFAALGDQREAMIRYNEWMAHVKEKDIQLAGRITQLLDSKRRGEDKVSVAMAGLCNTLRILSLLFGDKTIDNGA